MSEAKYVESFKCPSCGATIDYKNTGERTVKCSFCGSPAMVPEYLLTTNLASPVSSPAVTISQNDMSLIVKALQKKNKLEAIKVYRRATNTSLDVAKQAIAEIELDVNAGRLRA